MSFIDPANAPRRTVTPTSPFANSFHDSSESIFTALARMTRAPAMITIAAAAIGIFAKLPAERNLSKMPIAPNNSANSTVIPVRATVILSESIVERTSSERAKMPIAPAILRSVSALRLACIASRLPRTPSRIPPRSLRMPPPEDMVSDSPLMKPLIASSNAATIPVLKASVTVSKLIFLNASPRRSPIRRSEMASCIR